MTEEQLFEGFTRQDDMKTAYDTLVANFGDGKVGEEPAVEGQPSVAYDPEHLVKQFYGTFGEGGRDIITLRGDDVFQTVVDQGKILLALDEEGATQTGSYLDSAPVLYALANTQGIASWMTEMGDVQEDLSLRYSLRNDGNAMDRLIQYSVHGQGVVQDTAQEINKSADAFVREFEGAENIDDAFRALGELKGNLSKTQDNLAEAQINVRYLTRSRKLVAGGLGLLLVGAAALGVSAYSVGAKVSADLVTAQTALKTEKAKVVKSDKALKDAKAGWDTKVTGWKGKAESVGARIDGLTDQVTVLGDRSSETIYERIDDLPHLTPEGEAEGSEVRVLDSEKLTAIVDSYIEGVGKPNMEGNNVVSKTWVLNNVTTAEAAAGQAFDQMTFGVSDEGSDVKGDRDYDANRAAFVATAVREGWVEAVDPASGNDMWGLTANVPAAEPALVPTPVAPTPVVPTPVPVAPTPAPTPVLEAPVVPTPTPTPVAPAEAQGAADAGAQGGEQ